MAAVERTVIVGIDYSDFCIPALDEALRISAASPATRLVPLLALPKPTPTRLSAAASTTEAFLALAKDNLRRLVQDRARELGVEPVQASPLVCFGAAAVCLLAQALELKADLILVGSHSRQGFEHLLMGSVAEEVVRKASCSVLVARRRPADAASTTTAAAAPQGAESGEEFAPPAAPAGSDSTGMELLNEPHLDAGRVVLHVLDVASGRAFRCSFQDFSGVRVAPLESHWAPRPTAEQKARAARFALSEAARDAPHFTQLFAELTRRA